MKKIALYSLLAVAGMALSACNEDFKDWAEPTSPSEPLTSEISFQPAAVAALDLRGVTADSVVIFNPNMTITNANSVLTTYDVVIYNQNKTDSVTIKADALGRARRSELQGAIIALFGNIEQQRATSMNITANSMVDGVMVINKASDVQLAVTPQQQELPPVWFILGDCIGRGTFVNHATMGLYTSTVAMYVNPLNYEELIYTTYLCDNAQFKVVCAAGDREHYIGGASYSDNIVVEKAGYYKIIVNTADTTLRYEPYTGQVKKYQGMALSNGNALAVITKAAKGENHDWLGDLVVDTDAPQGEGIKFVADDGTTWGSEDFPAGKAAIDGAGIPYKSGTYKVVFNDIMGTFRFIAK